ncbi:MAG TPA: multicopper oxidase domain-containing protein [Beijerinckiaceae bacterium]
MKKLSRRQFVAAGAAAAGLQAPAARLSEAAAQPARRPPSPLVTLTSAFKDTTLDGNRVRLRAYNGQVPGPLIKTFPGDRLRIRVRNLLPLFESPAWDGNHDVPHQFDATNLHLHGMDVIPHLFEPVGTSNPLAQMISIRSGEQKDYVFDVPASQPPGLYWYHPHHHGSTVVQAVTGMAGAMIVYGAIDEVPEIKAARDILLAVQDIGLFPSDTVPDLWTYEPQQNAIWQTFTGQVTINGAVQPNLKGGFTTGDYALRYFLLNGRPFFKEVHNGQPGGNPQQPIGTQLAPTRFRIAPGEVVRFRMLNANSDNMMPILVEGHDMHLLAMDGVNYGAPRVMPADPVKGQVLLGPSNRAEFLIKGSAQPGVYRILQLAQTQQFLQSAEKVIAEIEIAGPPKDMALPTALPLPMRDYPLIKDSEIKRIRRFEFAGNFPGVLNKTVGIDFLINNALYAETEVPTVVRLGDAEEWHIVVGDAHHGGTEGHPFHIHVNSFEVISIGGVKQPPGTIQDTIWVPAATTVVIRMRFKQWTGKSVFHCHILPHEDTGMMQNFLILKGPAAGAHHRGT